MVAPSVVKHRVPNPSEVVGLPADRSTDSTRQRSNFGAPQEAGEPLFGVTGRIAVVADSTARQRQLLRRVLGALQLARQPGAGLVDAGSCRLSRGIGTSRTTSRECRGRVC